MWWFFWWAEKSATNSSSEALNSMDIKKIPLSRLETDLRKTLNECADTGQAFIVELSDHRFVTIQPLDQVEENCLTSHLLETNEEFRHLVAKSKSGPRKPFVPSEDS